MNGGEDQPEKTIRVYHSDNTYKNVPVKFDTPVSEVIEWICSKAQGGRHADPAHCDLFIIALGHQALRERRLMREDKPLQIQAKGGTTFKFLLRESMHAGNSCPEESSGSVATIGISSASDPSGHSSTSESVAAVSAVSPGSPSNPNSMTAIADNKLKMGMLERLLEDKVTWHPCMVILDEDRLWYSPAPKDQKDDGIGKYGGGMVYLPLCDCDRVMEGEDKKLLQLITKAGTVTLRAKSNQDRNSWLLAVVKQAALIKERDILLQAERIISGMEFRRASQQVAKLEVFSKLSGVLATKETRELLLGFARSEWEETLPKHDYSSVESFIDLDNTLDVTSTARPAAFPSSTLRAGSPTRCAPGPLVYEAQATSCSGQKTKWPNELTLEVLIAYLEKRAARADMPATQENLRACAFLEEELFPRFKEHPEVQCRMCWIAAGIT